MITLEHLSKSYGVAGQPPAVDDVSMTVQDGEICVLLGPSGCGKTTTLRMVNRLTLPSSGRVLIDGRDTTTVDTVELRRGIGYVIQQVGLFPNMTVEENICVVPKMLKWDRQRMRARAAELLSMVGLDPGEYLHRFPNQLSGGQLQRVGVTRALAADPPVMLMDEPFGAIDPINREVIQDQFLAMQRKLRKTILLVSHDIDEAVKMADRIAIFRAGRLEQVGTPDEILTHPANAFVADFLGGDRTLKRLRRTRVAQVASPLAFGSDHVTDVVLDGVSGQVRVDAAGRIAQVSVQGRDLGASSVRMEDDLRVVVSELLRLAVSWLPCVDAQGMACGLISQSAISRHLNGTPSPAPLPVGEMRHAAEA